MTESYLLSIILFAPFVGAAVLIFISNRQALLVRHYQAALALHCRVDLVPDLELDPKP